MVPIHNNGVPEKPKGIVKTIGEYAHAHSQLPLESLAESMLQQREMEAIEKTNEAAATGQPFYAPADK